MKASPFSFDEYQLLARQFRAAGHAPNSTWAACGLTSEAGKVAGEIKSWWEKLDAGVGSDREAWHERVKKECGDVLWYIALMADALDCSVAEIAEGNIAKLEARHHKHVRPTPPERPSAKAKAVKAVVAKKRGTKRK